jgi:glutathione S-transferase
MRPITHRIAAQLSSFVDPNVERNFKLLEDMLGSSPDGGKYLCGPRLTTADILLSYPILARKQSATGFDRNKFPRLSEYADALEKEEGYVRARDVIIAKFGSYELI